ncbi:MAG TPA: hypothetical protein VJN70_09975 [Gemmatimonadaceae bacterium]|nr:hypothetical protein [Gemmatimonadaceae bacterium]
MMPVILYRVSAVVLLLFAGGHQLGFRVVDPSWKADTAVDAMRGVRFPVQGFQRTYWEFFSGFGFFVTTLLLFSAYFAWSVGGVSADARRMLSPLLWAFAIAYVVIAILTWRYFFLAPAVLATLVALLLVIAAASVAMQPSATASVG